MVKHKKKTQAMRVFGQMLKAKVSLTTTTTDLFYIKDGVQNLPLVEMLVRTNGKELTRASAMNTKK